MLREPIRRTSKGTSQYRFAFAYLSTMFVHPPEPTLVPVPLTMPVKLDSHCTSPTGKPCTEKMSSALRAIVS